MRNTFKKNEHLKSKKTFAALFAGGKKVKRYPIIMVYMPTELTEDVPVQAGFSVSKRRFKHAVDRNRIKRQMREAYRLLKPEFISNNNVQYALVFIYIHHQKLPFSQIKQAIQHCLGELKNSN